MGRYLKSNFETGANLKPVFLKCALSAYVIFTWMECKCVDVLCVQKHTANAIFKCIELICISLKVTYCPKMNSSHYINRISRKKTFVVENNMSVPLYGWKISQIANFNYSSIIQSMARKQRRTAFMSISFSIFTYTQICIPVYHNSRKWSLRLMLSVWCLLWLLPLAMCSLKG